MHRGFRFQDRRLPKDGPTAEELLAMGRLLAGGVKELVSLRGRHWKAQGAELERLSDAQAVEAIGRDPLVLRRPVLWLGDEILLGYSQQAYREL